MSQLKLCRKKNTLILKLNKCIGLSSSADLGTRSVSAEGSSTPGTPEKQLSSDNIKRSETENTTYPHTNKAHNDILINLNENVYIQIQFISIKQEHHVSSKKVIFA
jgi:hypothetical protein